MYIFVCLFQDGLCGGRERLGHTAWCSGSILTFVLRDDTGEILGIIPVLSLWLGDQFFFLLD